MSEKAPHLSPEDELLLAKIRMAVEREGGSLFDEKEVRTLREMMANYEAWKGFGMVWKWFVNVMKWLIAFIAAAAAVKIGFEDYIQGLFK